MKRQLVENLFSQKVVTESSNGEKKYYMEGDTIKMNIFNGNDRRYRDSIIDPALEAYLKKYKLGKNTYGVLNHPSSNSEEANYVNPKEVSHLFMDVQKKDKDTYWTRSLVMNTPNGIIVKAFADEGAILGISTRGLGESVAIEGGKEDIVEYEFITLGDYVIDPSAPDAYLRAIMESKSWLYDLGKLKKEETAVSDNLNRANDVLKKLSRTQINVEAEKFFKEYFSILMNKRRG